MTDANSKLLKTLTMGKGLTMEIHEDCSKSGNDVGHYFMVNRQDDNPDTMTFSVPPHWHKYHDEIITVHEGRLRITLENKEHIVTADDGGFLIPRWHKHSMGRFKGEKLVVREETIPGGMFKALFFNDMLAGEKFPGFWHLVRSFYDWDTYVALPFNIKIIDQLFMLVFGGVSKLFVSPSPKTL